jgi:hypothetical protein
MTLHSVWRANSMCAINPIDLGIWGSVFAVSA